MDRLLYNFNRKRLLVSIKNNQHPKGAERTNFLIPFVMRLTMDSVANIELLKLVKSL